jgi:hypothetical protein
MPRECIVYGRVTTEILSGSSLMPAEHSALLKLICLVHLTFILAAPPLSTLHKVSSLASGSLLLASRSLNGQGTQAYSVLL